ncbi:MAG: iron-containing alcohol dehydrogenase, partial [Chloroflexi bacterium]|nr:iron-containing alcohol dehydrogenase [Chloroflexota bacterium]
MFTFSMPTRWKFVSGVSTQAGLEARRLIQEVKPKALVITDRGVQGAGLLIGVLNSLAEAGLEYSVFAEVEPNPRDTTVHAAAERFHDEDAGLFVAVGSGSVIDTAKGAAII